MKDVEGYKRYLEELTKFVTSIESCADLHSHSFEKREIAEKELRKKAKEIINGLVDTYGSLSCFAKAICAETKAIEDWVQSRDFSLPPNIDMMWYIVEHPDWREAEDVPPVKISSSLLGALAKAEHTATLRDILWLADSERKAREPFDAKSVNILFKLREAEAEG